MKDLPSIAREHRLDLHELQRRHGMGQLRERGRKGGIPLFDPTEALAIARPLTQKVAEAESSLVRDTEIVRSVLGYLCAQTQETQLLRLAAAAHVLGVGEKSISEIARRFGVRREHASRVVNEMKRITQL